MEGHILGRRASSPANESESAERYSNISEGQRGHGAAHHRKLRTTSATRRADGERRPRQGGPAKTPPPLDRDSVARSLERLGLASGDIVFVHSSD